jgi:hypothetical protein
MGLGLGPGMSLFAMAAQNAVPVDRIGVATSANQFFRQIGQTLGVALFGALLTHNLASGPKGAPGAGGLDLGDIQGLALQAGAGHGVDLGLRLAITHAITAGILASLAVVVAALAVIFFIPELPLRSRMPPGEPHAAPEPAAS